MSNVKIVVKEESSTIRFHNNVKLNNDKNDNENNSWKIMIY